LVPRRADAVRIVPRIQRRRREHADWAALLRRLSIEHHLCIGIGDSYFDVGHGIVLRGRHTALGIALRPVAVARRAVAIGRIPVVVAVVVAGAVIAAIVAAAVAGVAVAIPAVTIAAAIATIPV